MAGCFILINSLYDPFILKRYKESGEPDLFCADGGADLAYHFQMKPKAILGDLDSIRPEALRFYEESGVEIIRYPSDKDFTDLDLLLSEVRRRGYSFVEITCGTGGRTDHTLTNLFLMEKYYHLGLEIFYNSPSEEIFLVSGTRNFKGFMGNTISIIPVTDNLKIHSLKGLRYSAENLELRRGDSRGMSNIVTSTEWQISLEAGSALIIINKTDTI